VELTPAGAEIRVARTGSDGTAVFEGIPRWGFAIECRATGRVRRTAEVSHSGGNAKRDEDGAVLLALDRGVSLEGVVLSAPDRRPVPGARVSAIRGGVVGGDFDFENDGPLGTLETDAGGRFTSVPLPVGAIVTLTVEHTDFLPVGRALRTKEDPPHGGPVEVLLHASASIRGIVLGPDGLPREGAEVLAVPPAWNDLREEEDWSGIDSPVTELSPLSSGRPRAGRALSGKDGRFDVRSLPPGAKVRLYARVGEAERSPVAEVRVPEAGRAGEHELRLQRLSWVQVRVKGPEGGPAGDARLFLVRKDGLWPEDTVSADREDGFFHFEEVLPGAYRLRVVPDRFAPAESSVDVVEGRDAEVTVRVAPGLVLEGVLVDDAGNPVPEADVYVRRLLEGREDEDATDFDGDRNGKTGHEGKFRIEGLPAGTYSMGFGLSGGIDAEIPRVEAPASGLKAVATRYATAVARITVPEGRDPPRGISVGVTIRHEGGGMESGGADSAVEGDRLRIFDLRPGRAELVLNAPGFARTPPRAIEAAPGETVDLGTIALSSGFTVSGRVLDAAGLPVAGAAVEPDWTVDRASITDREGRFLLEHLAEGEVTLEVEADGYAPLRLSATAGPGAAEVAAVLARGGLVRGVVKREDSGSRATTVCFHPVGAAEGPFHPEAFADPEGRYEIRLPAGKYRVESFTRKGGRFSREIDVGEGTEQTLDVVVPRK
jgi:hypothetical protein